MKQLDDEAREALAEALSLAVGEGAAAFTAFAREGLQAEIETVEVLPAEALPRVLQALQAGGEAGPWCRFQQHHRELGPGRELSVRVGLPEAGALSLVRHLLGDHGAADGPANELEHDALAELANLLINRAMQGLARLIGGAWLGTLPTGHSVAAAQLLEAGPGGADQVVVARLVLRTRARELEGLLLIPMDAPTLAGSIERIRHAFGLEALETL